MNIDCRNLPCPQPVLDTKKALEDLGDEGVLEVLVNSTASKENVIRFATNNGCTVERKDLENDESLLTIVKGFACTVADEKLDATGKITNKTVFLVKSDKIGEGELGEILIGGFLKAMAQGSVPSKIFFVNEGVKLPTLCNKTEIVKNLKIIEERGCEIFSCGTCLNYFDLEASLKVGKISDALITVESLVNGENTVTLG